MILKNYGTDYKSVLATDDKGKVVEKFIYTGDWFQMDEKARKKSRLPAILGGLLLAVVYFAAGFTGGASGSTAYVVLPYVIGILPAAFLVSGAWGVFRAPEKMKREENDKSWQRLRRMSVFLAVCSGLTAIGQTIFLVLADARPATEWVFLSLIILSFAGNCIFIRFMNEKCKKIAVIPADTCIQK